MCEVLATAGIRVVAVARRRERLEALQQELISKGVPIQDFLPVVCDITKVSLSSRIAEPQQGTQEREPGLSLRPRGCPAWTSCWRHATSV